MIRHLGLSVREEPFGHMKAQDIFSFATDSSSDDAIYFFFGESSSYMNETGCQLIMY